MNQERGFWSLPGPGSNPSLPLLGLYNESSRPRAWLLPSDCQRLLYGALDCTKNCAKHLTRRGWCYGQ